MFCVTAIDARILLHNEQNTDIQMLINLELNVNFNQIHLIINFIINRSFYALLLS